MNDTVETKLNLENVAETYIGKTKWYIPYIVSGIEKIIDWNHPIWNENPSVGKVEIEAIHKDRFLDTKLKPFVDNETGVYIGIGTGALDPKTGRPALGGYKITTLTTGLKLSIMRERRLALFIMLNPMVRTSRNAFSRTLTMLKVVDETSSIVEDIETRQLKRQAFDLIDNMDDEEVEGIARITVGVSSDQTKLMIKNNVEKYAENNPKRFIEDVNQQDKSFKIYFQTAKDLGIVEYSVNKGWMFGAIALGRDELLAVEYLKDHASDIHATLVRDIESRKNMKMEPETIQTPQVPAETRSALQEAEEWKRKYEELQKNVATGKEATTTVEEAKKEEVENATLMSNSTGTMTELDVDNTSFTDLKAHCGMAGYPNEEWSNLKSTKDMREYVKTKQ